MEYDLNAKPREELGTNAARRLRRAGLLPAVKYGHGEKTAHITLDMKEFDEFLNATRGESAIINLKVGKKTQKAMVKRMERDPLTGRVIHVDFVVLHRGEEVTVRVPIVLTGESKGVKLGGVLEQLERDVRIKAVPKNIPPHIEIDVSDLDIGDSIHVRDLPQENITILADPDETVATILAPRKAVEEVPAEAVAAPEAAEEGVEAPEEEGKPEAPPEEASQEEKKDE